MQVMWITCHVNLLFHSDKITSCIGIGCNHLSFLISVEILSYIRRNRSSFLCSHAPAAAKWIREAMKARHVLLSTDGPKENILKMKPPLCFGRAEVDHLVRELRLVSGPHFKYPFIQCWNVGKSMVLFSSLFQGVI